MSYVPFANARADAEYVMFPFCMFRPLSLLSFYFRFTCVYVAREWLTSSPSITPQSPSSCDGSLE